MSQTQDSVGQNPGEPLTTPPVSNFFSCRVRPIRLIFSDFSIPRCIDSDFSDSDFSDFSYSLTAGQEKRRGCQPSPAPPGWAHTLSSPPPPRLLLLASSSSRSAIWHVARDFRFGFGYQMVSGLRRLERHCACVCATGTGGHGVTPGVSSSLPGEARLLLLAALT